MQILFYSPQPALFFTNMHTTKAQIKMFETIGILIVFFILISIALSLYFFLQKTSYTKDLENQRQQNTLMLIQKMLYLPELDCNFLQTTQDHCIERLKAQSLKTLIQTNPTAQQEYYQTFGLSTITITTLYPVHEKIILYDRTPTNPTRIFKTQNPIIMHDALSQTNSFAVIEITTYYGAT